VKTIFEREIFLELVELFLFRDHTVCNRWGLILDHSWSIWLGEGGCGRQGCANIEVWSFSSF